MDAKVSTGPLRGSEAKEGAALRSLFDEEFIGTCRDAGEQKWTADLVFGAKYHKA